MSGPHPTPHGPVGDEPDAVTPAAHAPDADQAAEGEADERAVAPVPARAGWTRLAAFGAIAAVAGAIVLPKVPRAQHVRLHLGPGASKVVRLSARVASGSGSAEWDRQASFRFERGAPPSVSWTFELPNGDAEVEVELSSAGASAQAPRVRIELSGRETTVELSDTLRRLE